MKTHSLADLLHDQPLLGDLPAAYLAEIGGCGTNTRFAPGEFLLVEGEPADSFFLIREGQVSIETAVPGRGSFLIETIGPGELVGWSWLVPPYHWHFDARAETPTAAVRFDGACLRGKFADDPRLGVDLLTRFSTVMVRRLQSARIRLVDMYGR